MEQMARSVAALAADSPLVMERVEVLNEITRLQNLETAHRTEFGSAKGRLRSVEREIRLVDQALPRLEGVLSAIQPEAGVQVADGSQPETATETAEAIRSTLRSAGPAIASTSSPPRRGTLGGSTPQVRSRSGSISSRARTRSPRPISRSAWRISSRSCPTGSRRNVTGSRSGTSRRASCAPSSRPIRGSPKRQRCAVPSCAWPRSTPSWG